MYFARMFFFVFCFFAEYTFLPFAAALSLREIETGHDAKQSLLCSGCYAKAQRCRKKKYTDLKRGREQLKQFVIS